MNPSAANRPPAHSRDPAQRTIEQIRREFPRFRIVAKADSTLSRVIDIALKIITLGGQSSFMTRYHTVIGNTLYVPPGWNDGSAVDRAITLRHEWVHLRQQRRYGTIGMALLYLLPIFPLGLAYGRARLEWEAYEETIRATADLKGLEAATAEALRERIVRQFTGPAYGWMWPFRQSVLRWYQRAIERIS